MTEAHIPAEVMEAARELAVEMDQWFNDQMEYGDAEKATLILARAIMAHTASLEERVKGLEEGLRKAMLATDSENDVLEWRDEAYNLLVVEK